MNVKSYVSSYFSPIRKSHHLVESTSTSENSLISSLYITSPDAIVSVFYLLRVVDKATSVLSLLEKTIRQWKHTKPSSSTHSPKIAFSKR
jgi:hypothetical protein